MTIQNSELDMRYSSAYNDSKGLPNREDKNPLKQVQQ